MGSFSISRLKHMHNRWLRSIYRYRNDLNKLKVKLNDIASHFDEGAAWNHIVWFEKMFEMHLSCLKYFEQEIITNSAEIRCELRGLGFETADIAVCRENDTLYKRLQKEIHLIKDVKVEFRRFLSDGRFY